MSAASVSIARYSRLASGDDVFAFIVMIHAGLPSMITVFACVYVNAVDDHVTGMPAPVNELYALLLKDLLMLELSSTTCTSRPACLRPTTALITFELSI